MKDAVPLLVISAALLTSALAAFVLTWRQRRKSLATARRLRQRQQELIERIAGGLAHELKNPLGALNLNLQLLQEELEADGPLPDASRERLSVIMRECRRLEDVLSGFLRYAMRRPLERQDVSLNDLIEDVITFLKPEIRSAEVSVQTRLDTSLPTMSIDPGLIKQALLNVIINAVEAMSGGGTLTIVTEGTPSAVQLKVCDTGEGISPDAIPHVFEAYFSTRKGGTGLGLAVTERIVEKHGGSLHIESEMSRGTTVTFSLPISQPPAVG